METTDENFWDTCKGCGATCENGLDSSKAPGWSHVSLEVAEMKHVDNGSGFVNYPNRMARGAMLCGGCAPKLFKIVEEDKIDWKSLLKQRRPNMNLQPLHDKVIIEPNTVEKLTKGGILIPDSALDKVTRGKVLAVGPGRISGNGVFVETRVKVGDEVIYGRYSGTELEVEDKKLLLMPEEDIFAVVAK